MTEARTIGELLSALGPFYRSVALERDLADPGASASYVLTPWLERGVREMLGGLAPDSTRRAWRIVGDFGVGKSALALALLQSLDPRVANEVMPVRRLNALPRPPRMLPVVLTGSRAGFSAALSRAVEAASLSARLGRADSRKVAAFADPFEALLALKTAARASGRWDGVLVVVDEMGKFLEAASHDGDTDVFRLQDLAEAAARSRGVPMFVLLVLHKGFHSYAEDWKAARRGEWERISERFDELVFDNPLSHTAALMRAALGVRVERIPSAARERHAAALSAVRALGWLGPKEGGVEEGCWPFHPSAVPVLARFFSRFGQNERSLFGFAASEEPGALRAFAANAPAACAMYGIPEFFDYVTSSFGHRLASRSGAGDWDRIGAVIERVADAHSVETAVVKTVGMLGLLDAYELAATTEAVVACLAPAYAGQEIQSAIERLLREGLLFRRPGRDELRLWTSRRVDLSRVWSEAESAVNAREVAGKLSRHLAGMPIRRHVLARRHSIQTGTSRRYEVACVPFADLPERRASSGADGNVVAVMCQDSGELRLARAWAAEATAADPTLLATVLRPLPHLAPTVVDLLRHGWLINNAASLQEDAYAMAESERATADLEARAVAEVEAALGLAGRRPTGDTDVFWDGEPRSMREPMHALVSAKCDAVYRLSPLVENELVNKNALTSAGAAARQRLIEAIFAHAEDPELGLAGRGNPPERALYLSLLRRGRLHRIGADGWVVGAPDVSDDPLRLGPALKALSDRLVGSAGRVRVADVYSELAHPPYGVRRGLVPLLLAVTLAEARHRIALFERGTFCPRLDGAAFMRILKSPEHFELQWMELEGVRAEVFVRLAKLLGRRDEATGLMAVVEPLVRFGADLPFHVRHSAQLGPEAKAVLRELSSARSPIDLIFHQLPAACDCAAFEPGNRDGGETAGAFVGLLEQAVSELRACYPRLLEQMREDVFAALAAADRAELARRASAITFRLAEQRLRTFALRLSDQGPADDAWTETLGGALLSKPPSRWIEQDVAAWRSRLDELAGLLLRAEAAAFGADGSGREAVRLSVTRADGVERAVIVTLAEVSEEEQLVANAAARAAEEGGMGLDRLVALLSLRSLENDDRVNAKPAHRSREAS